MQGIILKGVGGSYEVRSEGRDYTCHAKGVLRYQCRKPLVGDRAEIDIIDEEKLTANIIRILERKNELIRPAVANIDQAIVEFAARDPKPNLNLLDRFLLFMESQSIDVIIVFNKADLCEGSEVKELSSIYENIGYRVLSVSALNNTGIKEVEEVIKGKTSVWAGPSGVGKSSLINRLSPEEQMETGELSAKIMRGKNTTRHTRLLCCGDDTYVCDTPGFSSMDIFENEPENIKLYFPEFKELPPCRFPDCSHISEPGCRVKEAVGSGDIATSRYENYVLFYKESLSKKQY